MARTEAGMTVLSIAPGFYSESAPEPRERNGWPMLL